MSTSPPVAVVVSDHTPAYETATLETCEDEPIHVPGAIQPHGLLLALDASDRVEVVSANAPDMLGREADQVRGRTVADVLGHEAASAVRQAAAEQERSVARRVAVPAGGRLGAGPVDLVVHRSDERIVVELEPVGAGAEAITYRAAREAVARLTAARTVDDLCTQLAREIRDLTGFDRVMVYRFDASWNGEVVAEERRDDLEPFLGLHYPAGDIPAQARRLYVSNWTRLIADVGYAPVPLDPVVDPGSGRPLDLSHSVLRSVSPIHLEYLANMGVTASMSVSMLTDGDLWGLVACHHYAGPHHVSAEIRSAAEFLGQTASQLILDRVRSDRRAAELVAEHELGALMARLVPELGPLLETLAEQPALLDLVDASGAAVSDGDRLFTAGRVPEAAALREMVDALRSADGSAVATDRLAGLDDAWVESAAVAAGALVVSTGRDEWIAWFRPAQEQVVDWAGDPRLHDEAEEPAARLTPRASFDLWREVVRDRSTPWESWQLEIADRLQARVSREQARRSREQAAVAESLQRALVPEESPQVPGFDVVARYRPAADIQLGGDWWDVFDLPDGRVALAVGDVSGHGVEATTAMAQLRTGLRAYALDGRSPRETLDRLDHFAAELLPGRTATAVLLALDAATGSVEIANAGHLPPILLHADGSSNETSMGGPLLGTGVGAAGVATLTLGDGDLLLVCTDGLIERRGVPIDESIAALRSRASGSRHGRDDDLGGWVERLLTAVPGAMDDDATVVVIRPARGE